MYLVQLLMLPSALVNIGTGGQAEGTDGLENRAQERGSDGRMEKTTLRIAS